MRLQVSQPARSSHKELVGALAWRQAGELFTCSDDGSICRWQANGESLGQVCTVEAYFTDMAWCAPLARKAAAGANDVCAVACTDGSIRILSSAGRLERSIDAHRGAALVVRWTADGTALISAGEDGQVKLWSRNGQLRSTVSQADSPVYSACLSPDSELVLFSSGQHLTIRSLANSSQNSSWKAHDALVTAVDWSPVNGMIVSGGEDCRYKVWDTFGRCLYSSRPMEQAVTSLGWSPGGGVFAVGSFNTLTLCDRMGWSHSKARTSTGSLVSLAWSPDGTQLAAGGGGGALCFAQLLDIHLEDGRVHATLDAPNHISVTDILSEAQEQLEFREPVVQVSLGHGHLIATTSTQCHVFSTSNWATPHIFDLREPPLLLLQCERSFVLLDTNSGLQVCTYEGRHVCNPKPPGLRPELLSTSQVSLSNDTLAVVEGAAATNVRFYDTAQGRPLGEAYQHTCAVQQIALSQAGNATERLLAVVDSRKDLWLLGVPHRRRVKLASSVDNARWHDGLPLLAAMVDNVLTVWSWPGIVWVDEGLLPATCQSKQECSFGVGSQVTGFFSSKLLVRRSDGSQMAASIPPYALLLHDLARRGQWDKATRLCRFTQDAGSWALLAGLAVAAQQLSTAEAAYAAIEAVDKLQFVLHCKGLLGEERAAELALFRRQPDEAEALLLQAGLVYRAIKLRIKLHHWPRALELANKHQQHLDTVVFYRKKYLGAAGLPEVLPQFQALEGQVTVDEDAIRSRIKADNAKRAAAGGGGR